MNEWVVSQESPGAGRWIVHRPGGNRPHKIAAFETREEAEDCASAVTRAVADILGEQIRAGLPYGQ